MDRTELSRVIAVANGKGGVGKTSLATTVAAMSANGGFRVLLIDLDPQGNAGEDLGYTGAGLSDNGQGLVTAVTTRSALVPTIVNCRERLDVISGGEQLDDLAGLLLSRHVRGTNVADVLVEPLTALLQQEDYDLVVVDCPPGEPNLQLLALGVARWLLIPTRSDAASLKGMQRIVQRLVEARDSNPDLELLGVVLFDVPSQATRVKAEISSQIQSALAGAAPLFENTIRHSVSASAARGQGQLIHEFAESADSEPFWQALREGRKPKSPGSAPALGRDYAQLTHEILLRITDLEAADEQEPVEVGHGA
ncbi:Sporulation initiation inhibitor protein soj (plasmid) [Variovorax sp. PBS-H4]|uniref:ParA family protein n=1 Tax=Variovorax sp. PBS-H4 TaxID=434008 RepID=UPI001318D68F